MTAGVDWEKKKKGEAKDLGNDCDKGKERKRHNAVAENVEEANCEIPSNSCSTFGTLILK